MNHPITIGGLLLGIGVVAGTLTAAYGVMDAYGNMMADAAGDNGKQGCSVMVCGALIAVACLLALFA